MNRHRNLSFYIESLVLLFFLLSALVVLLRVFGAAQEMGMRARQKTDAALILQTVSADFSAQADPFDQAVAEAESSGQAEVEFLCDSQGQTARDGSYRVTAELQAEQTDAGALVRAAIRVFNAGTAADTPLAELETALYCPQLTGEAGT